MIKTRYGELIKISKEDDKPTHKKSIKRKIKKYIKKKHAQKCVDCGTISSIDYMCWEVSNYEKGLLTWRCKSCYDKLKEWQSWIYSENELQYSNRGYI